MHDIKKLPKWAQDMISELRSEQSVTGACITDVSIEMCGFKHDENSANAIVSVANALAENAKALGKLSDAVVPKNMASSIGPAISLSDIKGK